MSYADDYFLRPGFEEYDTFEEAWSMWQSWLSPITSTTPCIAIIFVFKFLPQNKNIKK
jgi:hypothetical protein